MCACVYAWRGVACVCEEYNSCAIPQCSINANQRAEEAAVVCKNRFSLVFSFLEGFALLPHSSPPPPSFLTGIYPGKITFLGIESDPEFRRGTLSCHLCFFNCGINNES